MKNTSEINEAFQKEKIIQLNSFFMKKIVFSVLISVILFLISIASLILIIYFFDIDDTIRISMISMVITFVLTTTKSIIDRIISLARYLTTLLVEEQRGLNKNMGIHIDPVEYEDSDESLE